MTTLNKQIMAEEAEKNQNQEPQKPENNEQNGAPVKKKMSLAEFKVKSFVTQVKVDQMQFLKTAGG